MRRGYLLLGLNGDFVTWRGVFSESIIGEFVILEVVPAASGFIEIDGTTDTCFSHKAFQIAYAVAEFLRMQIEQFDPLLSRQGRGQIRQ